MRASWRVMGLLTSLSTVLGCGVEAETKVKRESAPDQEASEDAFDLRVAETVAAPAISPNGGTMTGPTVVTLSSATAGAEIYYTLNGADPTKKSKKYLAPFTLTGTESVTVKAKAFKAKATASSVTTATFQAMPSSPPPPAPTDPGDDCANVVDACPVAGGVTWQCKKRFMYGVNYAWHDFGADFGGLSAWGLAGVSGNVAAIDAQLADMKAQGASVIRWWVFPDFRGDGITFDANDSPTGLGGSVLADLQKALELAAKHDLYLMLDLFSFDNFRPTTTSYGVRIRGLYPIVKNATYRRALVENVVRPLARAAEASPYRQRLITWELINEPEWAMTGPSKYGDPAFECSAGLQCLTHGEMETFLAETTAVLRTESRALISVGGAAVKWAKAWSGLDLDFYQFHTYDWVNQWYPYWKSPAQYGITDKPVVMGEYPINGLAGVPVMTMLDSWLHNGYGGGLAWAVTDESFDWNGQKGTLRQFAGQNACMLKY